MGCLYVYCLHSGTQADGLVHILVIPGLWQREKRKGGGPHDGGDPPVFSSHSTGRSKFHGQAWDREVGMFNLLKAEAMNGFFFLITQ